LSSRTRGATASPRSIAEWVSLSIALLLLAGVVGIIVWLWVAEPQGPPRFTLVRGTVWEDAGLFHLPVGVTNAGGEAVAEVRIEGRQADGPGEERAATTIDFLPVRAREDVVLVFRRDPSRVRVEVVSYRRP